MNALKQFWGWLMWQFGFNRKPPEPVFSEPETDEPPIRVDLPQKYPSLETRLLDFIGDLEAPAGYNQRYGERTPAMNLAELAVIDILLMQEMQIKNGARSTAVGRYQFINKTLKRLIDKLKIDPQRRFDPELQDQLAMELLRERGIEKFQAGTISLETFANNLAKEWASLPVLTPINGKQVGQSYYAHDGLNKALTTPERVREVLT